MNSLVISKIRSVGKSVERRVALLKWCVSRRKGGSLYVAHILAAKNTKYLRIAKTAVASFLYHNPSSQVVIHCDNSTYQPALSQFRYFTRRGKVRVVANHHAHVSWQQQKIELLCEIANTENNFYMDCDVRWNDSFSLPNQCAAYVSEFNLDEKSPFRELLPHLGKFSSQIEMLNTTFVYLFPGKFTPNELARIMFYHEEILRLCDSGYVAKLDIEQTTRLSEQLGFSIFLCTSGREHIAIKSHDGHMDGSFLESSYFGATGVEF